MLKGLFGEKTFLDPDLEAWVLEAWTWLMSQSGGAQNLSAITLATPSSEHFPPTEAKSHERALYVFGRIKTLMGIPHWPCELIAIAADDRHRQLSESLGLAYRTNNAQGLFQVSKGQVSISYEAGLVNRPPKLIAVLAHELAHYLLVTIKEPPPGGEEAHELLTELTVTYAGFGIFGANSAFEFQQDSRGWRASRSGYFSERTWIFALALFVALRGKDEDPTRWLKPEGGKLFRQALRYLERRPELLDGLRAPA